MERSKITTRRLRKLISIGWAAGVTPIPIIPSNFRSTGNDDVMKILVGYDGSESARKAIQLSIEYAKAFRAEILLVTSLMGGTVAHGNQSHHAEEEFESIKRFFAMESIPCAADLLVRGLSPGEDIVQYAEENDVDQIILGIKKKSRTGKLLFGSNAQYVILNAHCPVVTVK